MKTRAESERFWEKVEKTDTCWLWTGGTSSGYGRILRSGQRSMVYAHRWSYEFHVGPIPDGLVIDHLCRVRHCVNPDHLEPVTWRENIDRGLTSATKDACINGHEFTPENTHHTPASARKRTCRTCAREHSRSYRQRRAGVAQ
jgi:hypothetical protein